MNNIRALRSLLFSSVLMASAVQAQDASWPDRTVLPVDPPAFPGKAGPTVADSVPAYPRHVAAPAGAPNILLVMTDDEQYEIGRAHV